MLAVTGALFSVGSAQDLDLPADPLDKNLPAPVKRALFEAQTARDDGEYTKAISILEACLERYPQFDNFHLRFQLGINFLLADRSEEAKAQYEAAVAHRAESAGAWFQLARVSYDLGDYARAADAFETVNRLLPQPNALVLFYSGVACLQGQQSERAFDLLSQLVGGVHGPPGYDWCRTYVAAASDADRTRETIPVLEDLVEREPGNTDAWRLLYQAAATSNDYDQATVALTIADYIEGVSTQEIVQLGDLYVQIGVPAKAVDYYARAIAKGDFSGSTDLRERLAYAYIAAHDYDAAIEYLSGTLAEEPSARLESLLGDVYYQLDDYENALRAFLRSFELDPEDCRSKFMTGYCAYRLDRDDEARRHLQRLLDDATCEDHHERALQLIRAIDLRL